MSFTFNEWDIRDQIAYPKCIMPIGKQWDFNQWAKTQSIPAPGMGDGAYSVDKVKVITQQKMIGLNKAWVDCDKFDTKPTVIDGWQTRQILRLKPQSPLISGDREVQVDSKVETITLDELESLRSKVSELYLNGFLYEDQYQTIRNAIDKQLKEFGINTDEQDF